MSYKKTLFDRHGPDAGLQMRLLGYAMVAGGVSVPICIGLVILLDPPGLAKLAVVLLGPILVALLVMRGTGWFIDGAGHGTQAILEGQAGSTPYSEQNSMQQALVMQGRLDEALQSYEVLVAQPESRVDVRLRAAELYTREAKNHVRAAELFREAIRLPGCTIGEETYAVNRLVDLLAGPLAEPGRALVELRRFIDRHPTSRAAEQAREALRVLKPRHVENTVSS